MDYKVFTCYNWKHEIKIYQYTEHKVFIKKYMDYG